MSDTTIVTPALLESMIAQKRRCLGDMRHSQKCRRCARGVNYARRQEGEKR